MNAGDYLNMLSDAERIRVFKRAIERCVAPADIVLDLGTGLGTYAMFAARAGARVIAVDGDPVIELAKKLAADNGLSDRITFLSGWLNQLEPPERADVLIFEDYTSHLASPETAKLLEDARRRWLKPGARSIPGRVRLQVAPVSCTEVYERLTNFDGASFGLDLGALTYRVLNEQHEMTLPEGVLLGEPRTALDYDPVSVAALRVDFAGEWRASRDGELHGLAIWIDLDLGEGSVYSNAPGEGPPPPIWGQVLLPLLQPVGVRAGDAITARVATLGPGAAEPIWWSWRVRAGDTEQDLNTFRAAPLSLAALERASLEYRARGLKRRREASRGGVRGE